jgi:hypothetical protein
MSNAVSALWASIVRTVVPMIVGGLVAWLVGKGIVLDPEFEGLLTATLTAGFGLVYYAVVRLLETYVTPKLGWLLGLAKAPAKYTAVSPAKTSTK